MMKEVAKIILKMLLLFTKKISLLVPALKSTLMLKEAKTGFESQINDDRLISVIVPIYNVDRYLKRCLNSIINQTYKNLEIILVDDGSIDKSPEICDEYFKSDSRIIVIHKENGGLSSARNAGLEIASGYYVGFVDGDDYIEPTMYEKLKLSMDKEKSDIAVCGYYIKHKYLIKTINEMSLEKSCKGKKKFLSLKKIGATAWNKLYKKDIFKAIRYPNGKIYEDNYIICDILNKANKMSFVNEALYYYVMRKSSITNSHSSNQSNIIDSLDTRIDFFKKHKYKDLRIEDEYKKIIRIIDYAYKINAKDLNDESISKHVVDATKLANKLKNSEYLSSDEIKDLKLFLQDRELFYKIYKFKRSIKKKIYNMIFYK